MTFDLPEPLGPTTDEKHLWNGPISRLPAYDLKFSSTILVIMRRLGGPSVVSASICGDGSFSIAANFVFANGFYPTVIFIFPFLPSWQVADSQADNAAAIRAAAPPTTAANMRAPQRSCSSAVAGRPRPPLASPLMLFTQSLRIVRAMQVSSWPVLSAYPWPSSDHVLQSHSSCHHGLSLSAAVRLRALFHSAPAPFAECVGFASLLHVALNDL
jgi:hypothetical protein